MGRRFLGAEEMVDLCEDVGMGIKMQETDRLAVCQMTTTEGLNDASGY